MMDDDEKTIKLETVNAPAPQGKPRWRTLLTPAPQGKPRWRKWLALGSIGVVALLILGVAGNGIADYVTHSSMQRDKETLDATLKAAQTQYHVPSSRLTQFQTAEQSALKSGDGSFSSNANVDAKLVAINRQVVALEQTSPATVRTMTQKDLDTLNKGVKALVTGQYIEASGFQQRAQTAQNLLTSAKTTPQYFAADGFTLDQLAAVNAFMPTYQRLQTFTALIQDENTLLNGPNGVANNDLQCAQELNDSFWLDDPNVQVSNATNVGISTPEQQWPADDLTQFRNAATSADFTALNNLITAQTQQTLANETAMLPNIGANLLGQFKSDITLMQQQKQDVSAYQKLYDQDVADEKTSAANPALASEKAYVAQVRAHLNQIALPLIKAKTNNDLTTLNRLIAQGQAIKTVDPANGIGYPDAYEYIDPYSGVGDATQRLANAQTADDYQLVDNEVLMLTANIQAMLTNLKDNTPWNQAHATDTQLLNHYGIDNTKVIVVSLREQAARFYDNGKLVKAMQVTTGAPDLPSVPGIHCALDKLQNTVFTSPDPPGSPNYYQPTPIHFALDYSYYGYALHDAWWRSWFGKYSNLPHYDPAAFNGGSHGCINFNYSNGDAAWMFNFADVGTPIIVY